MQKPTAVTVCVDYWDYLSITAPKNKHHFEKMFVVTSTADHRTQQLCSDLGISCFCTDAFYRNGAYFNKWLALEEGLSVLRKESSLEWLCLLDADIIWPETIYAPDLEIGNLYGPNRRMSTKPLPEKQWGAVPLWPLKEFSGFTQIFHVTDPHLPIPPWHQTDWKHAGGADTFFQALWPEDKRIRLPFEVLHIGPNGTNWCGRVNPLEGQIPLSAIDRHNKLREFMDVRRKTPANKRDYSNEKINEQD